MKAQKVNGLDPGTPFASNAARIVRTRLDEMRSFAPAALEREATDPQHDMRIAGKRLRYVLEITGICFGDEADVARHAARDLQDVLGELHDSDVMLDRIAEHIERLRAADARAVRERAGDADDLDPGLLGDAPNEDAYRGLELLAVHFEARRALLFDRFTELWERLEAGGIWERLAAATADD